MELRKVSKEKFAERVRLMGVTFEPEFVDDALKSVTVRDASGRFFRFRGQWDSMHVEEVKPLKQWRVFIKTPEGEKKAIDFFGTEELAAQKTRELREFFTQDSDCIQWEEFEPTQSPSKLSEDLPF